LLVDTLGAVGDGEDGAYGFAGGVVAVLTEHRHEEGPGKVFGGLGGKLLGFSGMAGRRSKVAVNADPVHVAASADFIAANDRYVIFCDTGHYAAGTADTGIEVYGHAPAVTGHGVFFPPEGDEVGFFVVAGLRVFTISGEGGFSDVFSATISFPFLDAGELIGFAGFSEGGAALNGAAVLPYPFEERIGILSDADGGSPAFRTTITESYTDSFRRRAREDINGKLQRFFSQGEFGHIPISEAHFSGQEGRNDEVVIPAYSGEGVWGFLEPGIACLGAVPNRNLFVEIKREAIGGHLR
jgi:hypothetical protein